MTIYHITTEKQWREALLNGYYEAGSLKVEGFIHCSTEEQVAGVLERYFAGQKGLLKLVLNTEKLKHELKFELAPSINQEFPHIYGPINLEAVEGVVVVN